MGREEPYNLSVRRTAALLVLLAGCSAPSSGPPPQPPPPPRAAEPWSSPGFHISGAIPPGWTRREGDEARIVSLARDGGTIDLAVTVVDQTFVRPDEEVLERILEGRWARVRSSTVELRGVAAARGVFERPAEETVSTHVMWEAHEGATPGRKFVFHAILVAARDRHEDLERDFDAFLGALVPDLQGPALAGETTPLGEGWEARSRPKERALEVAGIAVPSPGDPFARRDVPVAAWLDARERLRAKRAAGTPLADGEMMDEALALYNVALHQIVTQVGAPSDVRPGSKVSPRAYLQLFGRANAALALNTAAVLKLRAQRDGRPWAELERLRQNAAVLEALASRLKDGAPDATAREGMRLAATAPAGDYRDLAFAWWKEIGPDAAASAIAKTRAAREAVAAGERDGAEELAREALAATNGAWSEAHRALAAALFGAGRLQNAAGAARDAVRTCPGHAASILELAEILSAAGRAGEALATLSDHDGALRDSIRDHALMVDLLRATACLANRDDAGARDAVESLLSSYAGSGPGPVAWDFGPAERALAQDAPGRDRILSLHAFAAGRVTSRELRESWELAERK